jgi:sulfonate transport system substrate-binding protein
MVGRKLFFFAKKNQKTLANLADALPQRVRQMSKSFCFFFQKDVLPSFLLMLCSTVASAATPSVIRIGVASAGVSGSPHCALSYVCTAHEQGTIERAFAPDGTKIEWHFYTGAGPAVNEALAGGQLDFAWQGDLPAIVGRSIGLKTRLLMVAGGRLDYYVAVPANSPVHTLADLRGKRLALFKGTNIQTVGTRILASAGLHDGDVEVVNLDPATSLAALVSGQIDATLVSFWGFGLRDAGKLRFVFSTADHSPKLTPEAALLVTQDFLDRYPASVNRLVAASLSAARWSSDEGNRQAIYDAFAKTGYPRQFFVDAYADRPLKLINDPLFDAFATQQYRDVAAIALRLNLIRRPVDVDSWIDPQPLHDALAAQGISHFWPLYAADGTTTVGE